MNRNWVLFFFVGVAPGLALLLRGLVWGADSFAFWGVSCGLEKYALKLASPSWFVWFIQNIINCNFFVLVFFMIVFYLASLWGIYQFGKNLFAHQALLFPILVGSLTPLFFIEALRFENDFFGWCLAWFGVGLYFWLSKHKMLRFVALLPIVFGVTLWFPSIFIAVMPLFYVGFVRKHLNLLISIGLILLFVVYGWYFIHSFTQGIGENAVAEEIPLVGIVFVLHIIHFWKKIPQPFTFYGIILLVMGLVKSKYMFLATPLLLIPVLDKHLKEGLSIPKIGLNKIPLVGFSMFLLVGWVVMIQFTYPLKSDIDEMKFAIDYSTDNNLPLYNDWGDGWTFEYLGFETKYKVSYPNPDWNNLDKPFVAYTKQDLLGCDKLAKKTQQCN